MWKKIVELMPSGYVFMCAALSSLIPLIIYKVNKKLHKLGDPPWKKKSEQ